MLILGIDDAGRGPLIGPMMLAGVLLKSEDEAHLKHEGVADSKTLLHPLRVKLAGLIKDAAVETMVVSSSPQQIDHSIKSGINLNILEAIKAADIINVLCRGRKDKIKIIIDCPSVNTKAWKATLLGYVKHADKLEVHCEHKADVNYPVVSSASILAKVSREEAVAKIREQYGEVGSGYPSDPITKEFLRKSGRNLEYSGIFRKSWQTWKDLFPKKNQRNLKEF